MTDFALARRNMIDGQLRPNRVTNAQLLAAIADLPRERFLPSGLRSVAYADDDVQHIPAAIVAQLGEGGRLGTVIAAASAGALGVAHLMVKEGGVASSRPIFDAGTPSLAGFAPPPRFTF